MKVGDYFEEIDLNGWKFIFKLTLCYPSHIIEPFTRNTRFVTAYSFEVVYSESNDYKVGRCFHRHDGDLGWVEFMTQVDESKVESIVRNRRFGI